jgi:hypothetical protein
MNADWNGHFFYIRVTCVSLRLGILRAPSRLTVSFPYLCHLLRLRRAPTAAVVFAPPAVVDCHDLDEPRPSEPVDAVVLVRSQADWGVPSLLVATAALVVVVPAR